MSYIDPDRLAQAKQMDLLTYLQNYEPHELRKLSNNVHCTRTHDSLKISNGMWMWHSRGVGGRSALDYLIKVRGMTLPDAAAQIMGQAAIVPPVFRSPAPVVAKPFTPPPPHSDTTEVERYLRLRGIDNTIIRDCIDTGLIYESHRHVTASGRTFVNAVFVGFSSEGAPKHASLRGIGTNFKGDAPGSDKRYSFSLSGDVVSSQLHLFECAIDLLSYVTLLQMDGKDYRHFNLLSLAGIHHPKEPIKDSTRPIALVQYLQDHPHIRKLILHLDNDEPGRLAAAAIMNIMAREYSVTDAPPPRGKDVNDFLRFRLGSKGREDRLQIR